MGERNCERETNRKSRRRKKKLTKVHSYSRYFRLQGNHDQTTAHITRINLRPNMNMLHSCTFAHTWKSQTFWGSLCDHLKECSVCHEFNWDQALGCLIATNTSQGIPQGTPLMKKKDPPMWHLWHLWADRWIKEGLQPEGKRETVTLVVRLFSVDSRLAVLSSSR